jgi:hypothetical protein
MEAASFFISPLFTVEHRLGSLPQTARSSKANQEANRFPGYAVFRVIEGDPDVFHSEALGPAGVFGKKPPQVNIFDLAIMDFEFLPNSVFRERRGGIYAHVRLDLLVKIRMFLPGLRKRW